ncbi:nucleotidyltransferase domain-containing protein [Candidatus Pacearchaeota archaeon]|nr:nucleotidyltransferase domain-containing protein [Candidatus Pacearchaeota archaeon]
MSENNSKENKENLAEEVKDISMDYKNKKLPVEMDEKVKEEMEKTRKELENIKKWIVKKYPFTMALGIIPPQASEKIEEEEQVPIEDAKKKPMHLAMIIPEENFKEITKIKAEVIKEIKELKQNIWVHIKTPVDVWNYCLDAKYDIVSAISMCFPLYDKGFLGSMRVSEIHKSMVLRKFEKYIVSYVIAGSMVRGDATKTSDVDVFCVIDDTDVKRMPRLELKEKLRNIIYQYIFEASELAGVKNKLNVQVYILTEFWESVKDAHPVIFTFLRDGVPLYDRGTFMPWKLLLKMGKLKPSPEAIDMFMSMGDKVSINVKRTLVDLVIVDIYWGVLTPAQALLMLYGLPPPTTKEAPKVFREVFVEKEKLLEKKYADILERIIKTYKDYEHEKIKEISGAEVDKFLKDAEDFLKRLKELREQIEKQTGEKTIEQIYSDVFNLLKIITGKKSEKDILAEFEKSFIKKGRFPEAYIKLIKDIIGAKQNFKKNKTTKHEIENARKNSSLLINSLIEFNQRCDLIGLQKTRMKLKTKEKTYELILTNKLCFLIDNGKIEKITAESGKIEDSNAEELTKSLAEQERKTEVEISERIMEIIRKKIGSFDIIL